MPNSRGVLVVEVDKACRDLKLLLKTIKTSKFYKTLIGGELEDKVNLHAADSSDEEFSEDQQRGSNHEASLQKYRYIINKLMREVVKLNQSAENQSKTQEVYRVKLVNSELRDEIKRLLDQING
jgi:hypothetical protein